MCRRLQQALKFVRLARTQLRPAAVEKARDGFFTGMGDHFHRNTQRKIQTIMIHILIGIRAQLIKMCPIMKELTDRGVPYNFVFLAQHTKTINEIIDQFGIKRPDYIICPRNRDITSSLDMIGWSCRVLAHGLVHRRRIFKGDRKGVVLIHGDAPPLLLGGLLAKAQGLTVGQVEAGLRSFNFLKPFPEELTRVISSKIGLIDLYFCQDETSAANVRKFYRYKDIIITNYNTIIDAIHLARQQTESFVPASEHEKYGIVTIHRFETISNPAALADLVELLIDISKIITLRFILHPPTNEALKKHGLLSRLQQTDNIDLIPRLSFFEFSRQLAGCAPTGYQATADASAATSPGGNTPLPFPTPPTSPGCANRWNGSCRVATNTSAARTRTIP